MKKIFVSLTCLFLLTSTSFAQKISADKVPAVVKAKFSALYPAVTDVKWELEKSNYEAGFKEGKIEKSVVIDPKGNLKETETEIPTNALPKNALDYLVKKYPGVKISEAAKIVAADGKVRFEAEVNKKDVLFDEQGTFIK